MGKHIGRVFEKVSLKPKAASHNNTIWYTTDTDGLLEQSPSWGSLYYKKLIVQKMILDFFIYVNREDCKDIN